MNCNSFGRWALVATGLCAAGLASAQQAQPAAIEEIVVTARRTVERLQDVPVSVTAFSAESLERIGATDTTSLQGSVPNLNIVQGRGSSNATNIFIRGIGQPDALQTFDPAIGFYVDDVYYSRIRGTQLELFDIERIEVLRGPQGTLFGKNTIGGALRVVTRKPGQEARGMLQGAFGNYGQLEGRAEFSGPFNDTLAGGLALFSADRDGYVTNPVTGEEYNDRDVKAARAALAFTPGDRFEGDVSFDWTRERSGLVMGQPINTLTTLFGVPILVLPVDVPKFNFQATPTPGLPNSTEMEHWGGALDLSWHLSDSFTLRSITAYRNLENNDYVDIDATHLETGDVLVQVDQDQTSQEFQGTWTSDRLTVVGGLFYMVEDMTSHQEAYADDLLTGPGGFTFMRTVDDDLKTTSWAAYANASWSITERLNLGLGVRYTEDKKEYFRTTSTFSTFPGLTANPAFVFNIEDTWDNTSPMISLDFKANDDLMFYGRVAQGYKAGGFNGRANAPGEQAPYDPENVTSYEIGAKSEWMGDTLRANVAIFYNDYRDFQARVSGLVIDPGTGLPSPELSVLNAGKLETSGAELEFNYQPTGALQFDAQIGYLDAQYKEFADARFTSFGGSRAFQTPAFSPEWTGRGGAAYTFDMGGSGSMRLAASARFRSRMALAVDNTSVNSNVEIEGLFQDDYWLYDASLLYTNTTGRVSVGVYGRNLSDEVYRTDGQEFSSVGNIRTVYYGAPRTWSVAFTLRF